MVKRYLDMVSNHHFDSVLFHPPGKTSPNGEIFIATNFHDSGAQNLSYLTL